jgi:hypothetical protein
VPLPPSSSKDDNKNKKNTFATIHFLPSCCF